MGVTTFPMPSMRFSIPMKRIQISLKMGSSRVRGGLVSTGQGSDHVTDYLYALFSKHWIKYDLME